MNKAPLDPSAGSVQAPAGSTSDSGGGSGGTSQSSIPHDLNSAHTKKTEITMPESSSGMGTGSNSAEDGPPNWQNQNGILDAASHGDSINGETTDKPDPAQVRRYQHPQGASGKESGPSGLSVGNRNMEQEGTSKHDKLQQDLKDGKPSRDGEGSAGMPFDAGN